MHLKMMLPASPEVHLRVGLRAHIEIELRIECTVPQLDARLGMNALILQGWLQYYCSTETREEAGRSSNSYRDYISPIQ